MLQSACRSDHFFTRSWLLWCQRQLTAPGADVALASCLRRGRGVCVHAAVPAWRVLSASSTSMPHSFGTRRRRASQAKFEKKLGSTTVGRQDQRAVQIISLAWILIGVQDVRSFLRLICGMASYLNVALQSVSVAKSTREVSIEALLREP